MKKLSLILMMLITFSFAKAQDIPGGFDQQFGEWGIVLEEHNNLSVFNTGKSSVVLQSDGKIVTFTEYGEGGNSEILVMRHNTDGTLDTSYGEDGYVHMAPMSVNFFSFDSEIVEDDNLLLLAYTYGYPQGGNMFLTKLDSNGNVITSFGNNGFTTYNTATDWTLVPRSMAIQDDGKIVVGGEYGQFQYASCILRFTADGQLDTTFGNNGMVLNESFDYHGWAADAIGESVCIAPDGRIYLCGYFANPNEEWGSVFDCKIVCVDQNGALVPTFGEGGVKTFCLSEIIDVICDSEVLPDGKLLVAGQAEIYVDEPGQGPNYELFVAKLNEDGSFDTNFGNEGVTKVQYMEESNHYCHEMAVADNGEIFIGGYVWNELKDMLITNFNADGTLNSNFGENGFTYVSFGGDKTSCATDLALQPDGKLVVVGHFEHEETFADYYLMRFHTAASLDAVEENVIANGVFAYPNPAVSEVRFANLENECIANVYDAMGRLVMSATVSAESALNVSKLTPGNYFVELIGGSQIIKTRFAK